MIQATKKIGILKKRLNWILENRKPIEIPYIVIQRILYIISLIIVQKILLKKRQKKIVVGCSSNYYTGNPRSMLEYLQHFPEKFEVYWIAKNLHSLKEAKRENRRVFCINSILGIPYFLRTKVWIISHTFGDIPILFHDNYKILHTWHGIGPKGITHIKEDYEKSDAWCVASEFSKQRHIKLWNAPPEKLFVTGFARMDKLHNYLKIPKEKLLREIGIKNSTKKVILYAPTYDVGLWPWENCYEEFEKFCKFCKEKNLILILRLHQYAKIDKRKLNKILKKYPNVYLLDMLKLPDTMKLIAVSDILVTDWSSIYTELFLTKRPIIYLEVNKEYFTQERGKSEIPPDFRAGEITHNNKEFFEALKIVLEKGNRFKEEQERLLKIIHGNVDGQSSKRVVEVIDKLMKK